MEHEEVSRAHTRALLVGADTFKSGDRLLRAGQARTNLDVVAAALTDAVHGVVPRANVTRQLAPDYPGQVEAAVRRDAERTRDLLVVYYVGHGWLLPHEERPGDQLYLTVVGSDPDSMRSSAIALDHLVDWALSGETQRVVLILDTCYSGNIAGHLDPKDRHLSVLTSAPQRRRVSAGAGDGPTPFTAALAKVLRPEPLPGEHPERDRPLTVARLGMALRGQQARQPQDTVFPWDAQERSFGEGASTLLARPLIPRPDPLPERPRWLTAGRRLGVRAWRRLRHAGRAPTVWAFGPGLPLWRRATGTAVLVALAAAVAWTGVSRPWAAPPPACPPPLELRLDTAPEEADAMVRLADAYERSAFDGGCVSSRVSVHPIALDTLTGALTSSAGWGTGEDGLLREAGPQPDLWFAQSSADLTYAGNSGATFGRVTPIATDTPVLAVTEKGRKALGLPEPDAEGTGHTDWTAIGKVLRAAKGSPTLLRPNPTVSGIGLVHFLGMARAPLTGKAPGVYDTSTTLLGRDDITSLERQAIGNGESVTDGADALCRLVTRRPAGSGDPYLGALTTLRQTQLSFSTNCPQRVTGEKILTYRIDGAPLLDHPLVDVDRHDSRTAGEDRRAEIERFTDWLSGKEAAPTLRALHYGEGHEKTVALSPERLGSVLATFRDAHPALRVTVLFDVSASMKEGGKFEAAKAAVTRALATLGEDARYQLQLFPKGTDGKGGTVEDGPWRRPATSGPPLTAADLVKGRQADLLGALAEARKAIEYDTDNPAGSSGKAVQHVIVLVTDGDYLKGTPPRVRPLASEAGKLGLARVQVHVAAMRPEGCVAGREPAEVARASGGSCSRLSDSLDNELSGHLSALAEGR